MSGNAGIRGYLLQSIVTVLDSFENQDWENVCLEPTNESEKVDIIWKYPNKETKVVQVKSSQNEITYSKASNWLKLLKASQDANSYELIVIGHVDEKLNKNSNIDEADIKKYPLDFELLKNNSIVKINQFFENRNRPKVSTKIIEIMLNSLNHDLSEKSVFGIEINRQDFEHQMVEWLSEIEKYVVRNPLIQYLPIKEAEGTSLKEQIVTNFLNLIGWSSYSDGTVEKYYDEKTLSTATAKVDYYLQFESKLKDDVTNHIFINSIHDFKYPDLPRHEITNFLNVSNRITNNYKQNRRISDEKGHSIFNILLWFVDDNSEDTINFISKVQSDFRYEFLGVDQQYFLVDNTKANFIISAIATAREYRENLPVKFLYPITEFNSAYDKIGKREFQLPPEYINTNILPIIKEDNEKISVLLFTADKFSREGVKRLIWFLIKLTSGLSNEYIIYFSDYDSKYKYQVDEVIRSFANPDIFGKIKVEKFLYEITSANLKDVKLAAQNSENSQVNDLSKIGELKINSVFREQLPYGDILKPILGTDNITASDLKLFLNLKGIFLKNSDKKRIIDLMVSLLFSPEELMEFINLINVKERPVNSVPIFVPLKSDLSIKEIFLRISPDFSAITNGLQAKLNDPVVFQEDPQEPGTFIFSSYVEKKDLTKQVAVNTTWDLIRVSYKKNGDKLVINTIETNSKDGKSIANRIVEQIKKELLSKDMIKNDTIVIKFSDFDSNKERVNFLLSFTDIKPTQFFVDQDIRSLKFIFDDTQVIPDEYKDKTDKDLVILFRGKNLKGIKELSEDFFKEIILLEELSITYKFEVKGVIGYYNVKFNFSDALKSKPVMDGEFISQPFLHLSYHVKHKVRDIPKLEKMLSREIQDLKIYLLRKFNKI
ncbi:hypothetical protein [Pedobacter suwonensis]|uniref:hypothetical protein n=1 Tax=Pedobacter suwonensis TaxID=332999 RepID=UPI00119DC976|nr:hypothetical protein [Pedobacter suwonensis]